MRRLAAHLAPTSDADDIVQEALIRAWNKRGIYDPSRGSVRTWLLSLVAERARRARVRARPLVFAAETDWAIHPIDGLGVDIDLRRAIRRLPRRQRQTISLYYYVGLSIDETAQYLACSSGTVKSTLHDARANLRARLEENGK
jgi:DNA-directed RNA polymerase specialized sigma24 family protein